MASVPAYKKIDLSLLHFPSDALTLGQLRQHMHGMDKLHTLFSQTTESNDLDTMLFNERAIAGFSFDKVGNAAIAETRRHELDGNKEKLCDLYIQYSLANTTREAEQLINEIETQAEQQARAKQGIALRIFRDEPSAGWQL